MSGFERRASEVIGRRTLLRRGMIAAVGAAAIGAGLRPGLGPDAGLTRVAAQGPSLNLVRGWNSVPWLGGPTPAVDAFSGLPLKGAWLWESDLQSWRVYRPQLPRSSLDQVTQGVALWLLMTSDATWQQPPRPEALPADLILPQGWSSVSWLGNEVPVGDLLGETAKSPVARALRWNALEQRYHAYLPGIRAEEAFAILHQGDVLWLDLEVGGLYWNPLRGLSSAPVEPGFVRGQATYYHQSLHGNVMSCGGLYDRFDPMIAAATGWECGTRLRIRYGDRTLEVVVQDTGRFPSTHVDLSEAGFQKLAPLAEGRIDVLIEQL